MTYFGTIELGKLSQGQDVLKDIAFSMNSAAGLADFRFALIKMSTTIATGLNVFDHISLSADNDFINNMVIYYPVFVETIATLEQYKNN